MDMNRNNRGIREFYKGNTQTNRIFEGSATILLLFFGLHKCFCVLCCKKNMNHTSKVSSTQYVTSRHLVSNPNKEKRKHVHYISCVCYMQKTDKGGFPISLLICRFGMVQYYTIKFTCQISKVVSNSQQYKNDIP